jgi:hypothetical protein
MATPVRAKLSRRNLPSAWRRRARIHEKLIFGAWAWLKYEKKGEGAISDFPFVSSFGKCSHEFSRLM